MSAWTSAALVAFAEPAVMNPPATALTVTAMAVSSFRPHIVPSSHWAQFGASIATRGVTRGVTADRRAGEHGADRVPPCGRMLAFWCPANESRVGGGERVLF